METMHWSSNSFSYEKMSYVQEMMFNKLVKVHHQTELYLKNMKKRNRAMNSMHKGLVSATLLTPLMIRKQHNNCVWRRAPINRHPGLAHQRGGQDWLRAGATGLRVIFPTAMDVHWLLISCNIFLLGDM
jgi:hypothetical protein